jgi:hypothetical protein
LSERRMGRFPAGLDESAKAGRVVAVAARVVVVRKWRLFIGKGSFSRKLPRRGF